MLEPAWPDLVDVGVQAVIGGEGRLVPHLGVLGEVEAAAGSVPADDLVLLGGRNRLEPGLVLRDAHVGQVGAVVGQSGSSALRSAWMNTKSLREENGMLRTPSR